MEYDIRMLEPAKGECPFEGWIASLRDNTAISKVITRIRRVRIGNLGDAKSVGGGVSELRVDYGPGYRVYFAVSGKTVVVLLGGGDKHTQQRDIASAQRLWRENKDEYERFQRVFGLPTEEP